jgi:hypothetical protein
MSMLNSRTELFNEEDVMNYGIYANRGLLVDSTSKRMLRDYSRMNLT